MGKFRNAYVVCVVMHSIMILAGSSYVYVWDAIGFLFARAHTAVSTGSSLITAGIMR